MLKAPFSVTLRPEISTPAGSVAGRLLTSTPGCVTVTALFSTTSREDTSVLLPSTTSVVRLMRGAVWLLTEITPLLVRPPGA